MKLYWLSYRFFRRGGLFMQAGKRRWRILPWPLW